MKIEEFWSRVGDPDPVTGCMRWKNAPTPKGYGQVWWDGRQRRAHRVAYELAVGPVPEGMVVDHICCQFPCPGGRDDPHRLCCNPEHLKPETIGGNVMRSLNTLASINAAKVFCDYGHEFDAANTYITPVGHRECRKCNSRRTMEYMRRKRKLVMAA